MCSIDGACEAPIPPTTLAMSSTSALTHLLADLGERCIRDPEQLDHDVDRHARPPEPDPVAGVHQPFLLPGYPELVHPGLLVALEELPLAGVLERVRRLVQPDAASGRLLVEEVEVLGEVARDDALEALEVVARKVVRHCHRTQRWSGE